MTIARAFRSNSPFINYALSTGEIVKFVNSLFYTTNERIANELEKVANDGHPDIYIDPNEKEVDTDALTPEAQMEKRIRAKIMAEMAEATRKDRDLGNYSYDSTAGMVTTQSAGQLGNQSGQVTVIPLDTPKSVMAQAASNQHSPLVAMDTPATPTELSKEEAAVTGLVETLEPAAAPALTPVQIKLAQLAAQKQ